MSSSSTAVFRIGILGAASIARKNVRAIQHVSNHQLCKLVAIASRSPEKGAKFVKDHISQEPEGNDEVRIYSGPNAYDELIASEDIDAVYMPLPTTTHLRFVKAALNAGKHVLVEKPVSVTVKEYKEMIDVAKAAQKFIMDGTMFVHNPRTNDLIDSIYSSAAGAASSEESAHGDIVRVQSAFTFPGNQDFFNNNIRVNPKGDPLGCIGDLGWYCIRMALLVFKGSAAISAQVSHYELNEAGVPIDATCLVTFQGSDDKHEKVLSFHCSFLHPLNQYASIYGTKQSIYLDDFIISRKEGGVEGHELEYHEISQSLTFADQNSVHSTNVKKSKSNVTGVPQEAFMWSNFIKYSHAMDSKSDIEMIKEGQDLLDMSFDNQRIVNALMVSVQNGGAKVTIEESGKV